MKKSTVNAFINGMTSAFMVSPVASVRNIEPVVVRNTINNPSQTWGSLGKQFDAATRQVGRELQVKHPDIIIKELA